LRTEVVEMGFSYDDPPNRVKEVMLDLMRTTPGVLADPPPLVRTAEYADFSINYRLIFSVESQADLPGVRDAIMTRLWYVIRRERLNIPFPTALEYGPGENPSPPEPTPADWLREHPRFKPALEHGQPAIVSFANGETAQGPGRSFEGFALVVAGRALLMADAASGGALQIGELGPGECFGESLTAPGAAAAIAAGWRRGRREDVLITAPQSDGGPGFIDVLVAAQSGILRRHSRVRGPLDGDVDAGWALDPTTSTAYIECAQACGLALLGGPPTVASAMAAHSRGVGQLIDAALQAGATTIVVGLGGSSCTDGGRGMVEALGGLPAAGRALADRVLDGR
jgi:hypothetical protein